jgi:hypothetical protein
VASKDSWQPPEVLRNNAHGHVSHDMGNLMMPCLEEQEQVKLAIIKYLQN